MALDFQGLFVNPADIRNQRLEGLAQQRRNISQMGGSMSGLLGQVAAGGSVLGEQLAEGIAGGLGLKTQQEAQAEAQQGAVQGIKMGNLNSMKAARDRLSQLDDVNPAALAALDDRIMQAEDRALQRRTANDARQRAIEADQRAKATFNMQMKQYTDAQDDETAQRAAIEGMLPAIDDAYMSPAMKKVVMTLDPAQALTYVKAAKDKASQAVKLSAFNSRADEILESLQSPTDPSQRLSTAQLNGAYLPLIESARAAGLDGKAEALEAERKARVENSDNIEGIENSLQTTWRDNTARVKQSELAEQAAKSLKLLNDGTGASDTAAIMAFAKVNDPGAVVTGSDFDLARDIGGLFPRFTAKFGELAAGEKLNPAMRKELANTIALIANEAADNYNSEYDERYQQYSRKGYDASYILGDKVIPVTTEGLTFGARKLDPMEDQQVTDAEAGAGF